MEQNHPGFLQQTASYLHRVYGDSLSRFCIVFPNIRAGLFFKKYLAQLSDKPVWSPTFRSLGSLMEEITGWTAADRLSMVFDLFDAYREHQPTQESFEEFYFWGEMLLDDFDDIDKHRVDAHDLFRNISDLKEIDQLFDYLSEEQKNAIRIFWQDFNGGKAGSLKSDFATIWPSLHIIYDSFKKKLREKSLGYEGMIQREAVRLLRKGDAEHVPFEKYVFIGFNVLTPCEFLFFKSLQKQNRAAFFWDYDDYYVNNRWHEAGIFMRDNIREFPSEWPIDSNNLTVQHKHIEIISVPSGTGQAGMAGEILGSFSCSDWNRVAVVLPDEHMLLPVLSVIPETVNDINITMGYPFTYSPANSLFERLAALQQHIRIYADGVRFYHQDVSMILHHPYVRDIAPTEAEQAAKHLILHNRIYVPVSEIPDHDLFRLIFRKCDNAREFTVYLLEIVSEIAGAMKLRETDSDLTGSGSNSESTLPPAISNDSYQLEYLYTFYTALVRMNDVLATGDIDMSVNIFCRLLRKVFASLKIPFSGEPLKGLQVMGMLETRALDFDRVIVLSMNEGVFPHASSGQSFIPYNLRKGFGLTTSERHDAVSAYHFYRLIQRATDIRLIYNSAATDRNTGEMSRFISQLIYEPVFEVHRRNISFHISIEKDKEIVRERTDWIKQKLGLYYSDGEGKKKLSPSAINSYLDCRLRFYFRYIEGLRESEQVVDEIDPSIFGLLLHKTMELLYTPYISKEVEAGLLAQILKNKQYIRQMLLKAFAEHYFHTEHVTDDDITGRNIIIREVLLKYIYRIIEVDIAAAPFKLLTLEKPLDVGIRIHNDQQQATLNMGGFIDRLEYGNGILRIVDYKTGNAARNFKSIADLFDRNKPGNHAVMQTLVYACMTSQVYPQYPHISSGLYVVKDLFREKEYDPRIYISQQAPVENYADVSEEFETELNALLSEMFLSDLPFTQTKDEKKCLNCPYADICHKKHH